MAPLLLLAACGESGPAEDPAKVRTPVPAAELRTLLPGKFIDERPYPCDAGPLALQADGGYAWYSGWGTDTGRYTIEDGKVLIQNGASGASKRAIPISFAKDGNDAIHYRIESGEEHVLKLAPIDANTATISCGDDGAGPPR